MHKQLGIFIVRCLLNSLGLWIAVRVFGTGHVDQELVFGFWIFIAAGAVFSFVNALLKPLAIILSLPAIMLTLGMFMIVVNGVMVYIALALTPTLSMTFGHSILAGIVLSLLNYILSALFEFRQAGNQEKN